MSTGGVLKQISFDSWQKLVDNQTVKDNGVEAVGAQFLTPNFLRLPGLPALDLH